MTGNLNCPECKGQVRQLSETSVTREVKEMSLIGTRITETERRVVSEFKCAKCKIRITVVIRKGGEE